MAARRMITKAELAQHNSEEDCWLVMHDLVFHLPKEFLDEHPGGPDVITALAGTDATQEFEDIAHSDSSRTWANKYIVGYVEGASDAAKTKEMPNNNEKESGRSGKADGMWAVMATIAAVSIGVLGYKFFK